MSLRLNYNVSFIGSMISFAAGACLLGGLNLLYINYDLAIRNKIPSSEQIFKLLGLSTLGGGLTSFGIYYLVPNSIRSVWSYSRPY